MNGRVYDPTIARFLSADPHIQAPGNLQSYNRYSYVMNNPLRYTDPSGYFWKKIKRGLSSFWKKNRRGFFKAMFGIVGYNSSTVRNIITGGACIMVPASCGAVTAANAYASGASTSDALKAGARGQIGAAIGQGVAGYAGGAHAAGTWQNIVGNGIGGGVQSRINGGSFRDGFVGGAFGAAFKPAGFKLFPYANQGLQRVITAGLVGGTGSYLSGGKFGYGAFSGAFGQYWNGERHVTYVGEDGKTYRVKVWQSAEGMMAEAAGAESIDAYNTTTRSEVATGLGIVSLMTTPYAWITGTAAVGAYVLSPSESNAFGVATIPLGAGARWLDEGLYYGQKGIEGVVENAGIINGIGGAADAMVPDELRSH
jgi:hypothetical protein